jgi:peroxiredoxin Q/BCP
VILGISFDSVPENRAFAEKFDYPFQLLCDTAKATAIAYGAAQSSSDAYPKRLTFVIGPDGIVHEAIQTKDPAGQAADLLSRL